MAKNNPKKLKTKQKIYQSLIQLSKHKSIKDVSVSEICRTASINRSTFYLHYQDISDLIMEFRQTNIYDFIDSIKEKKKHPNTINLTKSPTVFLDYKDLVQTIHYAQKEKDIVRMLLGKNGDPDFVDELKSAIRNLISYLLKDHYPQLKKNFPNVPDDYLEIILFDTSAEIIMHWMEKGMKESPEEISEIISSARIIGPLILIESKE